jgi:hypothetical protein
MGKGEGRTGFWWGNLGEREHLENLDMYGRIVLKRIFMKKVGAEPYLAQHRDNWWAVVNTDMNLWST